MKIKIPRDLVQYTYSTLIDFATKCKKHYSFNWTKELRRIEKGLSKFNIVASTLTSNELILYLEKKIDRRKELEKRGLHPSIIDLSYWEMFAPTMAEAKTYWDELNRKRKDISTQINKSNPEYRMGSTLDYQIKLYGEEDGTRRYKEANHKRKIKSPTSLEYWLNLGYDYSTAVKKRSERQQTFSFEKCVKKHGEIAGTQIWKNRQEKWLKTLNAKSTDEKIIINLKKNLFSIEGYLLRGYSVEDAKQLIEEFIVNFKTGNVSKESINFFEKHFNKTDWIYGIGKEWFIWDYDSNKHYFYDFTNIKLKIIIEYHGSAWHPNKSVLTKEEWINWKVPHTNITADEKYSFDQYKKKVAEKAGFKIFEIYSNDDPIIINKTIIDIKNEINKNNIT